MEPKFVICHFCAELAELKYFTYKSTKKDREGKDVIIPNSTYYQCSNFNCNHSWMSELSSDILSKKLEKFTN